MSSDLSQRETVFLFDGFRLDRGGLGRKHTGGQWTPIILGSRASGVLTTLLERPGEIVTRQDLMRAVWPNVCVEDSNLAVQISTLRRVLDEGRSGESSIQTVIGRGYRFLPAVTADMDGSSLVSLREVPRTKSRSRLDLSIVVLPFTTPGGDTEAAYLADVIADDVATDLSRLPNASVIGFVPAGDRDHGSLHPQYMHASSRANYAIWGSIRRFSGQVGANVRLVDAKTGANLWSERFDIDCAGSMSIREELTGRLVRILSVKLIEQVSDRIEASPREEWTSNDLIMRGCGLVFRPQSAANRDQARICFEQALLETPDSIDAKMGVAYTLVANFIDGWNQPSKEDNARAEQLLQDVLRVDANIGLAHGYMGMLHRVQGRLSESRVELEMAIALTPNHPMLVGQLGVTLTYLGQPAAAIPLIEKALRIAPYDTGTPLSHMALGLCHLLLHQIEEAVICLRRAQANNPRLNRAGLFLAAALGLRGDLDEAAGTLRHAININPKECSMAGFRARWQLGASAEFLVLAEKTLVAGLRKAGFPEI